MKSNKISVIIPIYNKELLLERCLQSIQAQTYSNIEVIMVNDGSSDRSEDICLSFVKEDMRFKYFYQKNAGVSVARNHGLNEKIGEYFTFVDSDDWIEPEYCQNMLESALTENSDMVFCGINYYIDGIKTPQNEIGMTEAISNRRVEHFLVGHPQYVLGSSCRVLFKSSAFDKIRFYENLHIYEDLTFLLNCIKNTKNISCVKDTLYNYDLPAISYFKKYYRDNIDEVCYNVGKILYDILNEFGYTEWAKAELFKEYCLAVNWICSVECDKKQLLKKLKNHKLTSEFCVKENYKAYKKLYNISSKSSRFALWLQWKKYNVFFNKCKMIKGRLIRHNNQ